MMAFNSAISTLDLIEVPLRGQSYTWSNKQTNPLLERLDWFFISNAWSLEFPATSAYTLTREASDHVPCVVSVQTKVPKARVFRFENFWMEHEDFSEVFIQAWNSQCNETDLAKRVTAKFKKVRQVLRNWQKNLPKLSITIERTKSIIQLLDQMEEGRDQSVEE
jgi:hypothetical protein